MTTDELLNKLPPYISRNGDKGQLHLVSSVNYWNAFYDSEITCHFSITMSNVANFHAHTANEALHELYDWCVRNGFIKEN